MTRVQQIGWIVVITILIFSLVVARISKSNWSRYARDHHCREVGHQDGAKVLHRTVYRCDGNEIIVR